MSAASEKLVMSRFSIYDWQRKVEKAAAGEGAIADERPRTARDRGATRPGDPWRVEEHPGLGPSQIGNQLRHRGVTVSVTTARRVMEDAGYRPPKVKRDPHDERSRRYG